MSSSEVLLDEVLKKQYPNGHPKFAEFSFDELRLHDRKNKNYAGGGSPLGNFTRVARIMANYPNLQQGDPAVALIGMVMKQIDNVLWALNNARFYTEPSIDEHLQDISVYMKILRCIRSDRLERQLH